ncbi:MAG TPA: protein kinase [Ktedonobacterales bacterium]
MATRHGQDPAALAGMRLGTCVLETPLGSGGMGAVYLARQERPKRMVAVKVLAQQLTDDPQAWRVFLARFRREADATAALDSANIVPIYEFGEQKGIAYLVMPYLSDGSLAQLLEREGPMPLTRVVRYVEQIAAALDLAHRQGVVHRDVKPSNMLLHPDGRLMLGDFGIARGVDGPELIAAGVGGVGVGESGNPRLTQAGATMGTPEYMAPEQARGQQVDAAADTYALGVVAYEMLAGDPPFTGDDINSVLAQQVKAQPPSIRAVRPEISSRVDEVLAWALAKDPHERPRTTGAFARALREAAQGRSGRTLGSSSLVRPPLGRESYGGTEALDPRARSYVRGTLSGESSDGAASADPEGHTLYDGPAYAPASGGFGFATAVAPVPHMDGLPPGGSGLSANPAWPVPGGGRSWRAPILMLAAAALTALIAIAVVVALFSQGGGSLFPSSNPNGVVSHSQTATPLPTLTPSPTPSPTPQVTNWLTVAPDNITLECKSGSKSASIRLTNLGPKSVDWSASASPGRAVSVQPSSGRLHSGSSTTVTITDTNYFFTLSGTVTFTADNDNAGDPATVAFKAGSCF